ncbi:RRS1-domain-containing protein [Neoconidiobolus thromboides FSU 785]|nr:RRS1-domain-containing protein [Neoconidiobolus thromboides FSU 785]
MDQIETQLNKLEEAKKSVQVEKAIPLNYDLGLLCATDINTMDNTKFKKLDDNLDDYLKRYCRDGIQLLLNQVFSLPVVASEDGYMVTLPKPNTSLPREKPIPKPKPLTRWEKFAKAKNITNKKRERMVYDEESGEYKPRYGYKGINQVAKDWLMEVPDGEDPNVDLYAKEREDKKSRVEKNLKRQMRNVREASGENKEKETPKEIAAKLRQERTVRKGTLERDAVLAKVSTASMGKFDKKIEGEAKAKGVRRKFEPTIGKDLKLEKDSSLKILNKLTNGSAAKEQKKKEVVNVRKKIDRSKEK